jgi:AraC family transcriptional regulator
MRQLTAIGEALAFAERHLKQEIAVADMANAAGYSLYHFCRVFNGLVHHTPYDYLMRRRLSQAAQLLLETDWNIVDVAFEYQFNSHETYSRAFKRMFGVPPSRYRALYRDQITALDRRVWMPRLTIEYLRHINEDDYLKPVLMEKGALQLTGLMSLVRDTAMIAQLWSHLTAVLDHLESADRRRKHYGVVWYPGEWQLQGCFYLAAIDARSLPDIPHPALVTNTLPPLTYARFVHKGPRSDLDLTRGYIYHTWLPQSDLCLSRPLEIEYHGYRLPNQVHAECRWEILIPIE